MSRKLSLEGAIFATTLVVLVIDASGGPGWGGTSARAIFATHFERSAAAPLYDLLASLFTLLPIGEPGFRLSLLAAVLGAATLAGLVAAARALLPRDPAAALVAPFVLLLAPPFREAVTSASPDALAACGTIWALATCLQERDDDRPAGPRAFIACAAVLGSAPWLAAILTVIVVVTLRPPRRQLAIALVALAVIATLLVVTSTGSLPSLSPSLSRIVVAGRDSGAIVIGAGLLGLAFALATSLPRTGLPAIIAALVLLHEILVGGTAAAALATLALGVAIIPAAIVRATATTRRHLVAALSAIPLALAALATGATIDDPGDDPSRVAFDLIAALPPGPGGFIATRPVTAFALAYERRIAGLRPDLALEPYSPTSEVLAVEALRANRIVGTDVPAFGRLDVRRAYPRNRGFELTLALPDHAQPIRPPATYHSSTGRILATQLALDRAQLEAASGRLDLAARAAGLTSRFNAADLALLAVTTPNSSHPPLFAFLPISEPAPYLLDLYGDDLAWIAGLPIPPPSDDAPLPVRLHAIWRAILSGTSKPEDAYALGPVATSATNVMLNTLRPASR